MSNLAFRPSENSLADTIASLRSLLGDRLAEGQQERSDHGRDESYHEVMAPDVVVYPETTEEVSAIIKICADAQVPVIPFGAGTSVEGHIAAVQGGVCLDMRLMNRVLQVRPDDLDVTVQPGITRKALNATLGEQGMFFPVDPGANASLGGMAATRASGTTTIRYGSMRDNVLSLEVVLGDGRVIRTSSRARKSSAGYDLTRLFIGSEGTLGVITGLTLRTYGLPEAMSAATCSFPSLDQAVSCAIRCVQLGMPVARAELLDDVYMDAVSRRTGLGLPPLPTLLFEFHGSQVGVNHDAAEVLALGRELGAVHVESATTQQDRNRLWRARHEAYYAALALRPGSKGFVTDVCDPVSRLARCIAETKADIAATDLFAPIQGHAGDGNFHVTFLIDPDNASDLEEARAVNETMVKRALAESAKLSGAGRFGRLCLPA